jgi:hypothetical protein
MNGERQFKGGFDGQQPGLQARIQNGGEFIYVGKGIYQVFLQPTRYIAMTGSPVTQDLEIPFNHRLVKVCWKHTDANNADNGAATAAILYEVCPISGLLFQLYAEAATTSSSTLVPFGEAYEYPSRTYRYSFNTTNNHRIYSSLFVQELRQS